MKFVVKQPQTLFEILKENFAESSNRTIKNWIAWGRVLVDGETLRNANSELTPNQTVALGKKENTSTFFPILYEDRYLVVINKPAGLLSVPDNSGEAHALGILRQSLKSHAILAVHRLDQQSSGVLLFAKGKVSEEAFDLLFEKKEIKREYAAIVEGYLPKEEGTWESYLMEKENFDVVRAAPEHGKKAITHYKLLRRSKKFSYLQLSLETGRKHQIRVHASDAGYPILGDVRYGSTMDPAKRLCLHAFRLAFFHPFLKKMIEVKAPLPKPFRVLGFPELRDCPPN